MNVLSEPRQRGGIVPPYAGKLLALIAVIVFVLVTFGVTVGSTSPLEMLAAGLAFFAASFLVP